MIAESTVAVELLCKRVEDGDTHSFGSDIPAVQAVLAAHIARREGQCIGIRRTTTKTVEDRPWLVAAQPLDPALTSNKEN